jgi:hypothetical protein
VSGDPIVSKACSGVTFKNKPSTPSDSVMDNIRDKRSPDKPLQPLVDGGDYQKYSQTLIPYFIVWAIFFIFSIIGL